MRSARVQDKRTRSNNKGCFVMDDLQAAYLLLNSASTTDGGCVPCVQTVIDEALHHSPDLPWEQAADLLRPESRQRLMRKALMSARGASDLIYNRRRVSSSR